MQEHCLEGEATTTTIPHIQNMLQYALLHPGCTCVWISRNYSASVEAFRDVFDYLKSHDMFRDKQRIDYATRRIVLENGSKLYFYDNLSPHYMRGLTMHWVGVNRGVEGLGTLYVDIIQYAQLGIKDAVAVLAHAPLDCYMSSLK